MNLTLSVKREVVDRARKATAALGLSLNQAIRNYLEEIAGTASADDDVRQMAELSRASKGRSRGCNSIATGFMGVRSFLVANVSIVRAALVSGCKRLFSEDLQHGWRIDGLEVVNPFL